MAQKLDIPKMTKSAEEALGWPYVSPGTNDRNGIDCSGLFVKIYRDQGAKIYHGSNTIFHEYCSSTGKLTSTAQLQPGMAVFKIRKWTDADKTNKWYGHEPGNMCHIGYVASGSPLRIIQASSVSGCVIEDTKIGKWAYWGKLKAVDYSDQPQPAPDPDPDPPPEPVTKYVWAASGSTVNMRKEPRTSAALVERIPIGDQVTVRSEDGDWSKCTWKTKNGYIMSRYLVDEMPGGEDHGDFPTLRRGDSGSYVTLAQTKLIQRGYSCGPDGADGDFGKNTEAAVKAFQLDSGLMMNGIIDGGTWAALDAPQTPMYCVIIPHLARHHAEALVANYDGATMTEEKG